MQFGLFDDPIKFDSFEDLVTAMMKLEDDPLFPEGTNMVIYRGNPEARLMIIGEAPGTEEDRQGKPFVGRSGQLLDQILEAVEIDPEADVFITNAVFRLPPGEGGKPLRQASTHDGCFIHSNRHLWCGGRVCGHWCSQASARPRSCPG